MLCISEYVRIQATESDVVRVNGHRELYDWCMVLFRWRVSTAQLRFEPLLWVTDKNEYRANKRDWHLLYVWDLQAYVVIKIPEDGNLVPKHVAVGN